MVRKALSLVVFTAGMFVLGFFGLAGCGTGLFEGHPLTEVADRVPVSVVCPRTDGATTRAAIVAYRQDPEALRAALVDQAKQDPVSVACLLLDARTLLLQQGRRAEKIYADVQEGLEALGVQ